MQTLTLTCPDDWHIHLRQGHVLKNTVTDVAKQFARAIVMPNLLPPVTTVELATSYRQQILHNIPENCDFTPLMTLYLTDNTSVTDIQQAIQTNYIKACKLYPAGATTHSDSGLTQINKAYPVFEAMQKYGMPLLIHGEVTNRDVDIFDREKVFIEAILQPLVQDFPQLKIVLEHITTKDAVDFVSDAHKHVAATITAHHLLDNRNAMLVGGIRPHYYCLPILKRRSHQQALLQAASSGSAKFFLGTDSAPHAQQRKESACGCAGCYTAFAAIELYAQAFDAIGALDKLEGFASFHGPQFYNLPINQNKITLLKDSWQIPNTLAFGEDVIIPYKAGEFIHWKLINSPALMES